MLVALLVAGAVVCAAQAIRATRLLESALWLAGVSALVSVVLYHLGAKQVAVIELSVGAGLVTVLFVFAISIAGDDAMGVVSPVPWPLVIALLGVFVVLLVAMILPVDTTDAAVEFPLETVLWGDRAIDVLLQIVLIFSGVLCLLGLLKDRAPAKIAHAAVDAPVHANEESEEGVHA